MTDSIETTEHEILPLSTAGVRALLESKVAVGNYFSIVLQRKADGKIIQGMGPSPDLDTMITTTVAVEQPDVDGFTQDSYVLLSAIQIKGTAFEVFHIQNAEGLSVLARIIPAHVV